MPSRPREISDHGRIASTGLNNINSPDPLMHNRVMKEKTKILYLFSTPSEDGLVMAGRARSETWA